MTRELEPKGLLLKEILNCASNDELLLQPASHSLRFVSCPMSWQLRNLGVIPLLEEEAFKRKR